MGRSGSFVPNEQTQELRDFLRTRKRFVRKRSSHIRRVQKTLEDANIKLDSVITDVMVSTRRQRNLAYRLDQAHLPWRWTLESSALSASQASTRRRSTPSPARTSCAAPTTSC
jgi:hypothetical protein